jgi:hypothetical protein
MKYTILTSIVPNRLTKLWHLKDGEPVKEAAGNMVEGRCQVVESQSLQAFADMLETLHPNQALAYGLTRLEDGIILSRGEYMKRDRPAGCCTRTKDDMRFPDGPAVFFIDYDPPKDATKVYTHEELWDILCKASPGLEGVGYVTYPSGSSCIYNAATGEQITGVRGQRIYFGVTNGNDIHEAGKRLFSRLWLTGNGWMEVSAAGSFIKRSIVDSTVWQSNRFDFAAGASCIEPLEQRRGSPIVIPGRMANLSKDIPTLTADEEDEVKAAMDKARAKMKGRADEVKGEYIQREGRKMAGPSATDEQVKRAMDVFRRAVEGMNLAGDFPIVVVRDGKETAIKVLQALDDPELYHNCETLDPLEPDYDGRRPVGKLFLLSGSARIYSFAHGGRTFKLFKAPAMIEVIEGRRIDAIERCLSIMRSAPEVFEHAGRAVTVTDKIHPMDNKYTAFYWLANNVQFYKRAEKKDGTPIEILLDPPAEMCNLIAMIGEQRQLKVLRRIHNAPTVTITGEPIRRSGYDDRTGILFQFDEDSFIDYREGKSIDDALDAAEILLHPFRHFPLVGPLDRAVLLASILAAIVRPMLDTCPGTAFDAPVQGSGKTLLAKSIAAIATGRQCQVTPHVSGRDDEEIRKRIMALLMGGAEAVVWDNIMGAFNSAALAGMLTAVDYSDRILGKTEHIAVPNAALWLFTGNNLSLAGDMPRRILRCRIDPQMPNPFAREFDFDPESYSLQNRNQIVLAGIRLIRSWVMSGRVRQEGRTASFERWDEIVRQPVAWLASYLPETYTDPMDALKAAQEVDPEQEMLGDMLDAFHVISRGEWFTGRDVMKAYQNASDAKRSALLTCSDEEETIHELLTDVLGRDVSSRRLGKYLGNRVDRIVRGKKLVKGAKDREGALWRIVTTESQESHTKTPKIDEPYEY